MLDLCRGVHFVYFNAFVFFKGFWITLSHFIRTENEPFYLEIFKNRIHTNAFFEMKSKEKQNNSDDKTTPAKWVEKKKNKK